MLGKVRFSRAGQGEVGRGRAGLDFYILVLNPPVGGGRLLSLGIGC